ncbi:MAG: hypothetical protein DI527_10230 [Chelatococcus sp.]|nr:MAG: hypothetical protein DI527_10230 [Chelatococcus sp.]
MKRGGEPPGLYTTLEHYPWVVVRFRCHACRRHGDARLARLSEKFGASETVQALLERFQASCPHRPRKRNGRVMRRDIPCGGYCPDLGSTQPPDHPPAMTGLTLIDGGLDDMLPAENAPSERRRRVGGDDG